MNEPRFLSLRQIDALHDRSLVAYGGSAGVRDQGGLESAAGQPQNDYFYGHTDLCGIAAAYCFHLAQAQAYLDGNKRTAVAAALTFLAVNGVSIDIDSDVLYHATIALATRTMDKPGLAALLRELTSRS